MYKNTINMSKQIMSGVPEFCNERLQVFLKKFDERLLLKPLEELVQQTMKKKIEDGEFIPGNYLVECTVFDMRK